MYNLKWFYKRFNIPQVQFAKLIKVSKTSLQRYEEAYNLDIDTWGYMRPNTQWKIEKAVYLIEERELVRPKICNKNKIENQLFEQQVKILLEKNGVL